MNFKQQAAAAAISLVKENDIVSLGAGATIGYAVEFLKKQIDGGLSIKFVASSSVTRDLLLKENLTVLETSAFSEIDIYLDGCDQFDKQLNALKSGAGIHTQEKLLASMAKAFVLIGDHAKLVDTFDIKYPLVVEMLPQALAFVPFKIATLFPGVHTSLRVDGENSAPVTTENGNYLLDIYFKSWPTLSLINPVLKNVSGIIETSLFYRMAHKAIIAGENGTRILERNLQ
jgi:ribose 5-phosphate isomerase A